MRLGKSEANLCAFLCASENVLKWSPRETWWAGRESNPQPDRYERRRGSKFRQKSTVFVRAFLALFALSSWDAVR